MNKGLKIALIIAGIGALGIAGYFIYEAIKKGRDGEGEGEGEQAPVVDPPAVVEGGNENATDKTPFTNKAQGNLFREWVNKFYPTYASTNDLSVSGEFDNSFMRKAWGKYGEVYKKGSPNFLKVKGNAIPENLLKGYNSRKDKGVLGSNSKGDIFLRTISLGKSGKNDFIAYFYAGGNVNYFNGSTKVSTGKWWDNFKSLSFEKRNFKGTDFYNTAYKVWTDFNDPTKEFVNFNYTNSNLQGDLEAPARKGLDFDMNIID